MESRGLIIKTVQQVKTRNTELNQHKQERGKCQDNKHTNNACRIHCAGLRKTMY